METSCQLVPKMFSVTFPSGFCPQSIAILVCLPVYLLDIYIHEVYIGYICSKNVGPTDLAAKLFVDYVCGACLIQV